MPILEIVAGDAQEVMALKNKLDIEAKLDPLSVGIVRRQLSSDSGMFCAITQYKHNRTYVTKLHTYVHTASSLPLADAHNLYF